MKIDSNLNIENELKLKKEEEIQNSSTIDGFNFLSFLENGLIFGQNNYNFNKYQNTETAMLNDMLTFDSESIKSLKSSFKYDCLTMDKEDAKFFAHAIKGENYNFHVNGEVLMQKMVSTPEEITKTYKSAEISKTLMNMLSDSQVNNKPVRIDFGNDISAILRVSQDGKITAQFIPSDAIAEEYLKNNISYLQQTFEEKDIPYNELSYRQKDRRQKQENQQNHNNKGRGEE